MNESDHKIQGISLENEIDDCPVCNNDYYNTLYHRALDIIRPDVRI